MKKTMTLVAAPTGMHPGGYIAHAYLDRVQPRTPEGTIEVLPNGDGHRVVLQWECPNPVTDPTGNTNLFSDAAALLVPAVKDAPLFTMGSEEMPVQAVLWRADREDALYRIDAKGLGTVVRSDPPASWKATSDWKDGAWQVTYELGSWPELSENKQIGFAIWRGEEQDRGGFKSITPGWILTDQ